MYNILDFSGHYVPTDYRRNPEYLLIPYADAGNSLPLDSDEVVRLTFDDGQPVLEDPGGEWTLTNHNPGEVGARTAFFEGVFLPGSFTLEFIYQMHEGGSSDARQLWQINDSPDFQLFSYPHGFRLWMARLGFLRHLTIRDIEPNTLAPGEWVCLSFGFDADKSRAAAVLRNLDGELLGRDVKCLVEDGEQVPAAVKAKLHEPYAEFRLGIHETEFRALRYTPAWREDALTVPQEALPSVVSRADSAWNIPFPRTETTRETTVGYDQYSFDRREVTEGIHRLEPGEELLIEEDLNAGLWTLLLYGRAANNPGQVWPPLSLRFRLEGHGGIAQLLKQHSSGRIRRAAAFSFHVVSPKTRRLTFRLSDDASYAFNIHAIQLVDRMNDIPLEQLKIAQNFGQGRSDQLPELTQARKDRDDRIWAALPGVNQPLSGRGMENLFSVNHAWPYDFAEWVGLPPHRHWTKWDAPLEIVHEINGTPWTGGNAWGTYVDGEYWAPEAELMYRKAEIYMNRIAGGRDENGEGLAGEYFETGNTQRGHDCAIALMRWAWDFACREMSLGDMRYRVMAPDRDYRTDRSHPGLLNGKLQYSDWAAADHEKMLVGYDRVFPYIKENDILAEAVRRFIPWIHHWQDVVAFLDTWLVRAGLRDWTQGIFRSGTFAETTGLALGIQEATAPLFDLNLSEGIWPPYRNMSFENLYKVGLNRDGVPWVGSVGYCRGYAEEVVAKAATQRQVAEAGQESPTPWHDEVKYPKCEAALGFLIRTRTAGHYLMPYGDASGGTHQKAGKGGSLAESSALAGFGVIAFDFGPDADTSFIVDAKKHASVLVRTGVGEGHAHNDHLSLALFGCGVPLAVPPDKSGGADWSLPDPRSGMMSNHVIFGSSPKTAGQTTGECRIEAFSPGTALMASLSYQSRDGGEILERRLVTVETSPGEGYCFEVQRHTADQDGLRTWCFTGAEGELSVSETLQETADPWLWDCRMESKGHGVIGDDELRAAWEVAREAKSYPHDHDGGGNVETVATEPHCLGAFYDANLLPPQLSVSLFERVGDTILVGDCYSEEYHYNVPGMWVQSYRAAGATEEYPALYQWHRGMVPVSLKHHTENYWQFEHADTMESDVISFTQGIEWSRLSERHEFMRGKAVGADISVEIIASPHWYEKTVTIATVDREARRLVLSAGDHLPKNPRVEIGREGRWSYWELTGEGTEFTWEGDTLCGTTDEGMEPYRLGDGNRKSFFLDGKEWHEFGPGDQIRVVSEVEVWRHHPNHPGFWCYQSNAPVHIELDSAEEFDMPPAYEPTPITHMPPGPGPGPGPEPTPGWDAIADRARRIEERANRNAQEANEILRIVEEMRE